MNPTSQRTEDTTGTEVAPAALAFEAASSSRMQQLVAARRRATALLVAVLAVFLAVTLWGAEGTVAGYVQAAAEAGLVGGIADWFAVTALFRRPLGLPIPHTALIVERKDQFGETLGRFFQENFLDPDVLVERIHAADPVRRLAGWLADEDNATRAAGHVADVVVDLAELLDDEELHAVVTTELTRRLETLDVAAVAGRSLRMVTAAHGHTRLFDAIATGVDRYLADHHAELRERFKVELPPWLPDAAYRLLFDRLHKRLRNRLTEMTVDPDDPTRRQFEAWVARLPDRLENDAEFRERGDRLLREILNDASLRDWSASLLNRLKVSLQAQAADPDSELRHRLADALAATGRRLRADEQLQLSLTRTVDAGARAIASQFHDEVADLVTGTIRRWDAGHTAYQLELLLGRDLQFIRINGTVVGAAVGVVLHAVTQGLA